MNHKNIKLIFNKFLLPMLLIFIFLLLGAAVYAYKQKMRYFFLFAGMGFFVAACETIIILFPGGKQIFRRIAQGLVGGGLFLGISLCLKVNFQFSEIIFDINAAIVTGALIQFLIARLIMPFFIGNAFCSRVCWDGAIFDLVKNIIPKPKKNKKRSALIAFVFLSCIIVMATVISFYHNPALNDKTRFYWIIGENIAILAVGIILSCFLGSRSYCRMLCPFITVSGLISKYSIFKINPVNAERCSGCGKCNKVCPMLVDVMDFVKNGKRINNRSCILCEECVSICNNECIKLAPGLPWK